MNNPANEKPKNAIPAGFRPMSSGVKRLEVPVKEGYHRRWFRGDQGRIQRALMAGYTFVDPNEVAVNNFDLGGDAKDSGNTDMGSSRVSVVSGDGTDHTGQAERMYLMEVPNHLYEISKAAVEARNDSVAAALRGGFAPGDESGEGGKERYLKGKAPELFIKKR